ncbi:MAG: DUF4350 domain-containing protein [Chloroflexi bacterium]|nr:DUF4350 domain-containing protein [Chloroflexota bacterium]
MKRLSRDSWLAIGLLMILVLVTIIAAVYQAKGEAQGPPLTSFSSAPNGALALWLWLDELGYPINNEAGRIFFLSKETSVVLVLEPLDAVTAEEWKTIDAWVEDGGTLVLAGDRWGTRSAARHYGFDLIHFEEEERDQAATLAPQTPLLNSPPLIDPVNVQTRSYFQTGYGDTDADFDFVTHLAAGPHPVMLSFAVDDGRVILSATPFPFSNAGLKKSGNPQLVMNIVAAANRPGVIWFDEWHHGLRSQQGQVIGPGEWLRRTPAGRSLLYSTMVIFVYIVLRGRRFGRPVPLPQNITRRTPVEHITAIANLNRRAGHRTAVLVHHHRRLKRDMGKRYRLDPTLPDDEYVTQLSRFVPNLDTDALRNLLAQLRQQTISESEMVQLITQVAVWLKES